MKRLLSITSGVVCLYLAYITGTGEILNYINFADPLNEMGFFICLVMMGSGLIYCGFAKDADEDQIAHNVKHAFTGMDGKDVYDKYSTEVPCSRELDMEMANESENIQ